MSVEAPHNPLTTNPDEPERLAAAQSAPPVEQQAQEASGSIVDTKVSRRGLLTGIGVGVLLGGGGLAWKLFGSNGAEQQPNPGPTDTLQPQPTASETETAEADPLSPLNLWKMTPEERLAAISVDKKYLNNPDYAPLFIKFEQVIMNAGTSDEEYAEWRREHPTDSAADYGKLIFDTYTEPLLTHLWGEPVNANLENGTSRQITHLVALAAEARTMGLKTKVDQFKTICEVTAAPKLDGSKMTLKERWSFPASSNLSVALPEMGYEEPMLSQLNKILYPSFETVTTLSGLHYNDKKKTVQPSSVFHKTVS